MTNGGPHPQQPNTLGKTSLILSVLASCFVFSIGLCAGVGKQQGWLAVVGTLLFLLGGSAAFVGLIGAFLGLGGLFTRPRGPALVGLVLGLFTVWLFLAILNAVK
jgi:hypothetical protein